MAKCSQVSLVLRHRENGHLLVVRPPCRLKTCDDCWPPERDRLEALLCDLFAKCPSCSIIFSPIGIGRTFWESFSKWARRNQRMWVGLVQESGEMMVILEGMHPNSIKVQDVEERIQYGLKHHDRTRRLTSSHLVRLTADKTASLVYEFMTTSIADQERISEIAEDKGLDVEWSGHNILKIVGTEEQIKDLIKEVA